MISQYQSVGGMISQYQFIGGMISQYQFVGGMISQYQFAHPQTNLRLSPDLCSDSGN